MAITFDTLKEDATIFTKLAEEHTWWEKFKNDKSLYIDIRKDNQVNVYFEGGSVARIHYCSRHKKLQIFTHYKYLGYKKNDGSPYIECSSFINEEIDNILSRIKDIYSQKKSVEGVTSKENWSEAFIKARLITDNRDKCIDSEFGYNEINASNRIDIVKVTDGEITFVELKRISDGRLLKKDMAESPDILDQISRYGTFIHEHMDDILNYYNKVYNIKKALGLPVPATRPVSVNSCPELLIFNSWEKMDTKRENRLKNIKNILKLNNISYRIIDSL